MLVRPAHLLLLLLLLLLLCLLLLLRSGLHLTLLLLRRLLLLLLKRLLWLLVLLLHSVQTRRVGLVALVHLSLLVLQLLLSPSVELLAEENLVELLLRHAHLGKMLGTQDGRWRWVEAGQSRLLGDRLLLCVLRLELRLLLLRLTRGHHGGWLARQLIGLLRLHLWCGRGSEGGRLRVGLALVLPKPGTCHRHLILMLHSALPRLLKGRKIVAILGGQRLTERLRLR